MGGVGGFSWGWGARRGGRGPGFEGWVRELEDLRNWEGIGHEEAQKTQEVGYAEECGGEGEKMGVEWA